MIRKIFYSCAVFFLGAAFAVLLVDCAKSVAFTSLSFTSVADFLAFLDVSSAMVVSETDSAWHFLYKILYYIPVWPVFLLPALLFYRLSHIHLHLWAHWLHKTRYFSVSSKLIRPLQHKN